MTVSDGCGKQACEICRDQPGRWTFVTAMRWSPLMVDPANPPMSWAAAPVTPAHLGQAA